ncbi:MAG: mechanosensitive ion channel family protein [Spirochaetes bacterium]|nr:mechanosensitive ion channel family protein [Spirochaetota bacterium]
MDSFYNLSNLWDSYHENFATAGHRLILAVVIIVAGWGVFKLSKRIKVKTLSEKWRIDATVVSILRLVLQYGIFFICTIMVLDLFGINTTGIIALLGTAGIAVGFALKDTMGNIAAGIVIIFLRPFKIGDWIEFGENLGEVTQIGLFATNLNTPDGICVTSPNSAIWSSALINYTNNPTRRMDIAITILYTDPVDRAIEVLQEVGKQSYFLTEQTVPSGQSPWVIVHSFGEAGINIHFRAWVPTDKYWEFYWPTFKLITEKIKEAGLTIALPRREMHIIGGGAQGLPPPGAGTRNATRPVAAGRKGAFE